MNIRTWIIATINFLLFIVVTSLYISFYNQFSYSLEEKVLSQLSSIERLKRLQIEKYLESEWEKFNENPKYQDSLNSEFSKIIPPSIIESGIYDLTPSSQDKHLTIGLLYFEQGELKRCKILNGNFIQQVLLERTGMGESGETYIVGRDYKLRSSSRFYTDQAPYSIDSKTENVLKIFSGGESEPNLHKDYRGVEVYSVYNNIKLSNIDWVILSEIDEEEVMLPLHNIKIELFFIAISILIFGSLLGLYLTNFISKSLKTMSIEISSMTAGNYSTPKEKKTPFNEINDVLQVLDSLKKSLVKAINYSNDIGEMKLDVPYAPNTKNDVLGLSLLKMKKRLKEYQEKILIANKNNKKALIEGQESERKRLAKELHDGIGVLLTTMKMYVENADIPQEEKDKFKELIDNTVKEVRSMTFELMPPALIDFGVGHALDTFVTLIGNTTGVDIVFDNSLSPDESKIETSIAVPIFRICQELVNNTVKHANASVIRFSITEFDDYLSIYYFDNGVGYNHEEVKLGSGLINIKERVEILNGSIKFDSKERNSIVEIEIPF